MSNVVEPGRIVQTAISDATYANLREYCEMLQTTECELLYRILTKRLNPAELEDIGDET